MMGLYTAAFWLLLVAWQWVANNRQQADIRHELTETVDSLICSRKRESALEAHIAALTATVLELQAKKVSADNDKHMKAALTDIHIADILCTSGKTAPPFRISPPSVPCLITGSCAHAVKQGRRSKRRRLIKQPRV